MFQLVSEVAYEETFLLVEDVVNALPVTGHPVYAIPNRGVLLAADGTHPAAVKALIAESRQRPGNGPWLLSGLLFERRPVGAGTNPLGARGRGRIAARRGPRAHVPRPESRPRETP